MTNILRHLALYAPFLLLQCWKGYKSIKQLIFSNIEWREGYPPSLKLFLLSSVVATDELFDLFICYFMLVIVKLFFNIYF